MKNRLIRICLLVVVLAVGIGVAEAQTKKTTTTRTSTKKKTPPKTTKSTNKSKTTKNPGALAVAPPKDTTPVVIPEADIKMSAPKPSLRNDYGVERNLIKDRTPLAYEHIREDDATYVQRVW